MTWFEIQPQDVWLFRDGKPFAAGEDHIARSMFPPTPMTVQGALRQKISMSLGVSLAQYKAASGRTGNNSTDAARQAVNYIGRHGDLLDVGRFTMRGPFVSLRVGDDVILLLPAPADLLKSGETGGFRISDPRQTLISDLGDGVHFAEVFDDYKNLPDHWMTADAFEDYLNGQSPAPETLAPETLNDRYGDALSAYDHGKRIWHENLVYKSDNRTGVSTNAATSFREEGQLYQVQFVSPQPGIGLLADVTSDIPTNLLTGPMTIGGEQRHANVKSVKNVVFPSSRIMKRFKVVLLTPAWFDDGWQPKGGDWSRVFGQQVRFKSAALYRPLKIGGWNSENGTARHMHNYVAPGSVYYFETNASSLELPTTLTQNPEGINAPALGFGQYVAGQW